LGHSWRVSAIDICGEHRGEIEGRNEPLVEGKYLLSTSPESFFRSGSPLPVATPLEHASGAARKAFLILASEKWNFLNSNAEYGICSQTAGKPSKRVQSA